MDGLLQSLTETELALVREVEPERLTALDEDALIDLHTRIRRARNKQVKLYRRQAAAAVGEAGARGVAHRRNTRNRGKAEVFEQALARVSHQLAEAAEASAAALRVERMAETPPPARAPGGRSTVATPQVADRRPDSPALRRRQASTRATGARRQLTPL